MHLPRGLALTLAGGLSPWLARWARGWEKRILADGEPLPVELMEFAESLGILWPEEIRVREIAEIPLPVSAFWVWLGKKVGLPVFPPGGMAIGRGIFLAPGNRLSLRHELVHVLQYQQLGGIKPFMDRYVFECLSQGYAEAELEIEARELSVFSGRASRPVGTSHPG
jgi:hypothetical protein